MITKQLAERIAAAKATGGGNLITDGDYIFEVEKILLHAGYKGTSFIAEMRVVESEPTVEGVAPNKGGSAASLIVNLDKNPEMAPGNVKAFVLALLGLDESATSTEQFVGHLEGLLADAQPARGMLVADTTFRKKIQKGPNIDKPFTGHKWSHVPQTAAEVASRRAAQEARGAK